MRARPSVWDAAKLLFVVTGAMVPVFTSGAAASQGDYGWSLGLFLLGGWTVVLALVGAFKLGERNRDAD